MPKISTMSEYKKNSEIKEITSPGVHEVVVEMLKKKKAGIKTIIDLGAGYGALSARLKKEGFSVTAADLHPENFRVNDIPCLKCNLNEKITIKQKFDAVACIEVIEHVENPWQLIESLHTLVKEKGIVILSTPNNQNWYSRLYYLFKAKLPNFMGVAYDEKGGRHWDSHITPIFLYMLKNMIRNKFRITKIGFNRSNLPFLRLNLPFRSMLFSETIIIEMERI